MTTWTSELREATLNRMKAVIVVLVWLGCSSSTGVSDTEAAHRLVVAIQGITDLACGDCTRCDGDRCHECLLQINVRLGDAMKEAVGPLGHGRGLDDVVSFDELALPADAKAAIATSRAKLDVCYKAIETRHQTPAAPAQP